MQDSRHGLFPFVGLCFMLAVVFAALFHLSQSHLTPWAAGSSKLLFGFLLTIPGQAQAFPQANLFAQGSESSLSQSKSSETTAESDSGEIPAENNPEPLDSTPSFDEEDTPAPETASPADEEDVSAQEPPSEFTDQDSSAQNQDSSAGKIAEGPENTELKAAETEKSQAPQPKPIEPPRVDGTYVGGVLAPTLSFIRVKDENGNGIFYGGGGSIRVGEVVLPWLALGLQVGGHFGTRSNNQTVGAGALLVEAGFFPIRRYPFSLRTGFGAGGGAVQIKGASGTSTTPATANRRSGFGGAVFTGAVRYDFFPGAKKRRATRAGGFTIGPELGWIGFTPAAKGRPMSNTIYLGVWIGYYFGR